MGLRYALDLGASSIGWAVYRTGDGRYERNTALGLVEAGVRLYGGTKGAGRDAQRGESLAVARRGPRAMRRRRDRFLLRRRDLVAALAAAGLWPADPTEAASLAELDPYRLRAEGLERLLTPFELGRALFHLNQRRGFRSNRKTDRDTDKGKIAAAVKQLKDRLDSEGARTLGEFLWRRQRDPDSRKRKAARVRLKGEGVNALYDFYPSREMIEQEFNALFDAQARLGGSADPTARQAIHRILFRQRPLKPPKIGWCTFVPNEPRLPKALPSVEARVIYETLNHVEIEDGAAPPRRLSIEARNALAAKALGGRNVTMRDIRKAAKVGAGAKINFEDAGHDKIEGAASAFRLHVKGPIADWTAWPLERRDAFVRMLIDETEEDALLKRLVDAFGLSVEAAERAAAFVPAEGYARLGATANAAVLKELKAEVVTYAEAVKRAGWRHSDERDGVITLPLPYYPEILQRHVLPSDGVSADIFERLGRIPNPTVHICLNQTRRLVNALVARFGPPDEIVLELARDLKNSQEKKRELEQENRKNREAAEARSRKLVELGEPDTGENRARLRLHEEQAKAGDGIARCPYTLRTIGLKDLFSSEIDIDHVLPMSLTLDDTRANKVLCFREANRTKGNKTPFDAFGRGWTTPAGRRIAWEDIAANAARLHKALRWRFLPDAMERFNEDGRDFAARQLNDTRYLSRVAKAYLGKACDPDKVWAATGRMTAMLRGKWGLNDILAGHNLAPERLEEAKKNRNDHRHNAIDAIVLGAMTRGFVNAVAHRAGLAEMNEERLLAGIDPPFDGFRDAVRAAVERIVVSHKPDHGKAGKLHEETAYGRVFDKSEAAEIGNLVRRKPIDGLSAKDIDRVRDPLIRAELAELRGPFVDAKGKLAGKEAEKAFRHALQAFGEERRIRRLRVGAADDSIVAISDRRSGKAYKAVVPGENHHMDVVQMRDGSWHGYAATLYEVNRPGWRPRWEAEKTGGKLVMRLHKGDTIELEDGGKRVVKVVTRLSPSNNIIYLVPHNAGGDFQKRHDDKDDVFRWDFANVGKLKERGAVAVRVDETGAVRRRRSNV